MNINFSLENAVNKRYSVRNYNNKPIPIDLAKSIKEFSHTLDNPFGKKVNYHYFGKEFMSGDKLRGSYGIIQGSRQYIAATINLEPNSLEALGYELEVLVLYLANLDIGSCYLGLTFDRKGFLSSLNLDENEVLPILLPYGYASDKKRLKDFAMRKLVTADKRKSWDKLFYKNDFNTSLNKQEVLDFSFALEMVRLAPSASNKQPWRVLYLNNSFHFYEYKKPGYSDAFSYDIQKIDMGIAAAHFDLAMKEQGMSPKIDFTEPKNVQIPKNIEYRFSWIIS